MLIRPCTLNVTNMVPLLPKLILQHPVIPVLRTDQGTLHVTLWQTCLIEHHLNLFGKHSAMLQLMCRLFIKLKHISTTVHQTSGQIH